MEELSFEGDSLMAPLEPGGQEPGKVKYDPPEETGKHEVVD